MKRSRLGIFVSVAAWLALSGCAGTGAKSSVEGMTLEESPGDLYVNMASAYYQRDQMDAALDRALRAVAEDKKNPRAHYVLAIVYKRLGKTQEAEKHFSEAAKLDPTNPDLLNAKGTILCVRRDYDGALKEFQRALDNPLYKTPEVALMNAADCSRRANKPTEAERFLREALTANPQYAPALMAMAKRSYEIGSYQDARGYMGRYSRVGQPTAEALLLASQIEQRLGNKAGAKALAESLRQRYPDAPQLMQL
jgi:type IV pilus assembly protein PilF